MMAVVKAEIRKLLTVRTTYALLAGLLAVVALAVLLLTAGANRGSLEKPIVEQPFFVIVPSLMAAFVFVLGARSFTDEFRFGTITPTLLVTPRRGKVVAAKMVVAAVAGLVFALVAEAVVLGAATLLIGAKGAAQSVSIADLLPTLSGLAVATAAWAVIGAGVGAWVRHQVAAIVAGLLWLLVAEQILPGAGVLQDVGKFLPGQAARAFAKLPQPDALAAWIGGLILALYTLLFAAVGSVAMHRRDIA